MEPIVDIVRNIDCGMEDDFFVAVVKETMARSGSSSFLPSATVSVGIALVSDDEIAGLNRAYRSKDAPTDVLSFAEYEGTALPTDADIFLGDLVISPEFVRRAAEGDDVPFERELVFVVSHGILHLLGLDHSEEMFRIQDEVTEELSTR